MSEQRRWHMEENDLRYGSLASGGVLVLAWEEEDREARESVIRHRLAAMWGEQDEAWAEAARIVFDALRDRNPPHTPDLPMALLAEAFRYASVQHRAEVEALIAEALVSAEGPVRARARAVFDALAEGDQ